MTTYNKINIQDKTTYYNNIRLNKLLKRIETDERYSILNEFLTENMPEIIYKAIKETSISTEFKENLLKYNSKELLNKLKDNRNIDDYIINCLGYKLTEYILYFAFDIRGYKILFNGGEGVASLSKGIFKVNANPDFKVFSKKYGKYVKLELKSTLKHVDKLIIKSYNLERLYAYNRDGYICWLLIDTDYLDIVDNFKMVIIKISDTPQLFDYERDFSILSKYGNCKELKSWKFTNDKVIKVLPNVS